MDISLEGYHIVHVGKVSAGILREKRLILGLTQKQVAEKAGVTSQQYQKFESGERDIMNSSLRIASRVIEALGMDVTRFCHNEYALGEEIFVDEEGMKYAKTGRLVDEDIE